MLDMRPLSSLDLVTVEFSMLCKTTVLKVISAASDLRNSPKTLVRQCPESEQMSIPSGRECSVGSTSAWNVGDSEKEKRVWKRLIIHTLIGTISEGTEQMTP